MKILVLSLTFISVVLSSPAAAPAPTQFVARDLEPRIALSPPTRPTELTKRAASGSWKEPSSYVDFIQVYGVLAWQWGGPFIDRIAQLPPSAYADPPTPGSIPMPDSITSVFLPAGSASPASLPMGGTGFYGEPLSLSEAMSVTFTYKVFFPLGFDWVLGGKLPGLFGGHPGCTGGRSAQTCFSTKMMWRADGLGELYAYAPDQARSDPIMCAIPPTTLCKTQPFGISIGRGAFTFATGEWTTIRQDITLNTPGGYDGQFTIYINGVATISGTTMYWRSPSPAVAKRDQIVVEAPHHRKTPDQVSYVTALPPPAAARANATHERRHVLERVQPAGFIGVDWQVFFDGDGPGSRTPIDQTIYFTDVGITINA